MKIKLTMVILATFLLLITTAHSQVSITTNVATTTASTEYVGYNGTGGFNRSLDIKNLFGNYNINFWTNNATTTTQKMTILGNNTSTDGYVGIGTTFTPNFKLDVDAGDINLNSLSNGYRIGGGGGSTSSFVLWHNGIISSIYVGVGAGNLNLTNSNTFVGFNTGKNTGNTLVNQVDVTRNTFLGHSAVETKNRGKENTLLSDNTCKTNSCGYHNPSLPGYEW